MIRSLIFSFALFEFGAGTVVAQVAAQSAEQRRDEMIRQLVARVESLEAEVHQLKTEQSRETANAKQKLEAPLPASDAEAISQAVSDAKGQEAASAHFPDVQFHGFADIRYSATSRRGTDNSFALGQLDFFITSQLSEDVSVLDENVVEANDENAFGFEVERLLLQYTPSDYFNIAAGRAHTAIGWYNNAYHHGTWFQTAIGRPLVFNFEDDEGILAIHNVGVTVSGSLPSGPLGLHYVAEVGNGRDYSNGDEPVLNVVDTNDYKALNLELFVRPTAWPGLQAGLGVYHDRLTTESLPDIDQFIFSGHAVYLSPAFEWLNEAVVLRHAPTNSDDVFYTLAFYSQIARQFGKFRPYARYQYMDAAKDEPLLSYIGQAGLRHGPSIGLRYDFTDLSALKLQFDHYFETEDNNVNQLTLQVGFTF
jgi:hypothetical protein